MRHFRVLAVAAAATIAGGSVIATVPAAAAPAALSPASKAEASLRAASDQPPTIYKDSSGLVRAVSAKAGHPLRRPAGLAASASPEAAARAFLGSHGAAFGLRSGAEGLRHVRTHKAKDGVNLVRFQQQVGGVPVIAGDVVVSTRQNGDILSATSEISTQLKAPGNPRVSKDDAIRTAIAAVAKKAKVSEGALRGSASRWMFDPRMIGSSLRPGLSQVWRVEVTSPSDETLGRLVLVDATAGVVALNLELFQHAKERIVCDYFNGEVEGDPSCETWQAARTETSPPSTVFDVNKAFDYSGATYDFYQRHVGRDSIDNRGMPMVSVVRVCRPGIACPYDNAFWNGNKMVYGQGYPVSDDVVAHELTHGVTQYTSNLFYAFQSGAINESMSDIFGEFIDQENVVPNTKDGAAYNWQLGEDLKYGQLRNMADPTKVLWQGDIPDPDRMTSPYYFGERHVWDEKEPDDNGGVHFNSGVGNKAAYLMAAPGTRTFNGVTVTGIGIPKATQVYYLTQHLLTSGSDYADLAFALDASCQQLATKGTAGITAADCTQVHNATLATDMAKPVSNPSGAVLKAPVCPTGATASVIASDDIENGPGGAAEQRWDLDTPNWSIPDPDHPKPQPDPDPAAEQFNAKSGKQALHGLTREVDQPSRLLKASATWRTPISVPKDKTTFLWFAHDKWFEIDKGRNLDGARVEYRADGGPWTSAESLFVNNGYNGNMHADSGQGTGRAFTANSRGYMSSRFDLTRFAGRTVEVRFVVLGNANYYSDWFIDDVTAYSCAGAANGAVRDVKATGAISSATLTWSPPEVHGATPYTAYQITSTPAITGLPATVQADQPRSLALTGLTNTAYTVTITPVAGATPGTPVSVALKPTTVGLKLTPGTVVFGSKVTLTGQVNVVGGGVAAGGSAKILGRQRGTTAFTDLGVVGVASNGTFSFAHAPTVPFQYVAHYINGTNLIGSGSGLATVGVAPQVGIKPSATKVKRGTTVAFTGNTNPARKSMPIYLQVYSGGAWRVLATGTSYTNGAYKLAAKLGSPGKLSYRVVVKGDATYSDGISASVAITVT